MTPPPSTALPGVYGASPWEDQRAMLQVLLVAVCELTHKPLPGMIERGYGRILNVASAGYEAVEASRAVCVPGAPNKAMAVVAKILPEEWTTALMEREAARGRV